MTGNPALQQRVAWLERDLAGAAPGEIVRAAVAAVPAGQIAVVSSFGIESAALLALVAQVDRALPVLLIDSGWLYPETVAYRDDITRSLGLTAVRAIHPAAAAVRAEDPEADLWARDPDACCALRKVIPLANALQPFAAWVSGRKRYQGGARADLPVVEPDGPRLKFNPLARATPEAVAGLARDAGLPPHPLEKHGFRSIGCMPCSSRARAGEGPRAGRWRGRGRTECGIHTAALTPPAQ